MTLFYFKRRIVLIGLLLVVGFSCMSQTENVLNTGGAFTVDRYGNSVTYGIGEVVIDTKIDSPIVVTQGVVQPEVIIEVGLQEIENLELSVFPNPTSNYLNIAVPDNVDLYSIQLYDQRGKLLTPIILHHSNSILLQLSELPNAYYNLVVVKEGLSNNYKVIKTR